MAQLTVLLVNLILKYPFLMKWMRTWQKCPVAKVVLPCLPGIWRGSCYATILALLTINYFTPQIHIPLYIETTRNYLKIGWN